LLDILQLKAVWHRTESWREKGWSDGGWTNWGRDIK